MLLDTSHLVFRVIQTSAVHLVHLGLFILHRSITIWCMMQTAFTRPFTHVLLIVPMMFTHHGYLKGNKEPDEMW